jgi:hypothetical protein
MMRQTIGNLRPTTFGQCVGLNIAKRSGSESRLIAKDGNDFRLAMSAPRQRLAPHPFNRPDPVQVTRTAQLLDESLQKPVINRGLAAERQALRNLARMNPADRRRVGDEIVKRSRGRLHTRREAEEFYVNRCFSNVMKRARNEATARWHAPGSDLLKHW